MKKLTYIVLVVISTSKATFDTDGLPAAAYRRRAIIFLNAVFTQPTDRTRLNRSYLYHYLAERKERASRILAQNDMTSSLAQQELYKNLDATRIAYETPYAYHDPHARIERWFTAMTEEHLLATLHHKLACHYAPLAPCEAAHNAHIHPVNKATFVRHLYTTSPHEINTLLLHNSYTFATAITQHLHTTTISATGLHAIDSVYDM